MSYCELPKLKLIQQPSVKDLKSNQFSIPKHKLMRMKCKISVNFNEDVSVLLIPSCKMDFFASFNPSHHHSLNAFTIKNECQFYENWNPLPPIKKSVRFRDTVQIILLHHRKALPTKLPDL
jgi:hypothetical protein